MLAQTSVSNEPGDDSKPTIDSITKQLIEHLGTKAKAETVISSVLKELNKTFDDQTVIPILQD